MVHCFASPPCSGFALSRKERRYRLQQDYKTYPVSDAKTVTNVSYTIIDHSL